MPLDGAKTHIGRNFDLDLSACIQGKSFQRSTSTSHTSSNTEESSFCANVLSGRASCVPSGQSICGSSEISPSPLSSATDSPLPTGMAFTPRLHATLEEHGDPSPSSSSSFAPANDVQPVTTDVAALPDSGRNSAVLTITAKHHSTTDLVEYILIPELDTLFRQPSARRTINVLSHLLDSRLPASWREPLTNRRTPRPYSLDPSPVDPCHFGSNAASPTVQADDPISDMASETCLMRRQIVAPDEVTNPVKRSKQDDYCSKVLAYKVSSDLSEDEFDLPNNQQHSSPPNTFVSPNLVNCVRQLADHFESRYRNKLGNLLDDVAGLSGTLRGEEIDTIPSSESTESSEDVKAHPNPHSHHPNVSTIGDGCPSNSSFNATQTLYSFRERLHTVLYELFDERINWGRIVAMLAFVRALCEVVESRRPAPLQQVSSLTNHKGAPLMPQSTLDRSILTQAITTEDESGTGFHSVSEDTFSTERSDNVALDVLDSAYSSHPSVDQYQQHRRSLPYDVHPVSQPRAAHYVAWTAEFIHQPNGIWNWINANGGWDGLVDFEHGRVALTGSNLLRDDAFIAGLFRTDDETLRLLRRAVTGVATLAVGAVGLVAAFRYLSKSS